jgi:adenosylcobinamide-GDP ribazoletransferase
MTLRSFGHALQFLTRLPAPRFAEFNPEDLSRSAIWFPLVGILIGGIVAAAVWAGAHGSPWIGALAGLVVWVWGTGGLHIDGLADVSDALAAAHRAPERFLEVLRDPHIGTFGAVAIGLQLIAKLVLLAEISTMPSLIALMLVPAWARWGTLVWRLAVPPLASGSGERFSWQISRSGTVAQGIGLAAISLWLAPVLLAAVVVIPLIAVYWRIRLGGITGDCLGASVEVTETLLLLVIALAAANAL